ncbi:MAG TPA: hypothetical protein VI248_26560 [Kineosporiaceae bacterium]
MIGPEIPDLEREAIRLADRLRVLGPRWAARAHAPDADVIGAVREALQRLADLAADAARTPRREVPRLALHALADQALVLAREAARAGATDAAYETLVGLRRRL